MLGEVPDFYTIGIARGHVQCAPVGREHEAARPSAGDQMMINRSARAVELGEAIEAFVRDEHLVVRGLRAR